MADLRQNDLDAGAHVSCEVVYYPDNPHNKLQAKHVRPLDDTLQRAQPTSKPRRLGHYTGRLVTCDYTCD